MEAHIIFIYDTTDRIWTDSTTTDNYFIRTTGFSFA